MKLVICITLLSRVHPVLINCPIDGGGGGGGGIRSRFIRCVVWRPGVSFQPRRRRVTEIAVRCHPWWLDSFPIQLDGRLNCRLIESAHELFNICHRGIRLRVVSYANDLLFGFSLAVMFLELAAAAVWRARRRRRRRRRLLPPPQKRGTAPPYANEAQLKKKFSARFGCRNRLPRPSWNPLERGGKCEPDWYANELSLLAWRHLDSRKWCSTIRNFLESITFKSNSTQPNGIELKRFDFNSSRRKWNKNRKERGQTSRFSISGFPFLLLLLLLLLPSLPPSPSEQEKLLFAVSTRFSEIGFPPANEQGFFPSRRLELSSRLPRGSSPSPRSRWRWLAVAIRWERTGVSP